MVAGLTLAITGGTGFLGGHVIDAALAQGASVRALARRDQPARAGVTWVPGALDTPAALVRLVTGADTVIHVAGVINAPDRAGFVAGNVEGTRAVLAAAQAAGVRRFVHISSLAAREPGLSSYGWSKAEADALVMASSLNWTIVRPPAIFGPRDREMLALFRCARLGVVPLPPRGGRLSVVAATDLADLLVLLARNNALTRATTEPDDGRPGGWDHRDFARAIGAAFGRRVLPVSLPRPALAAIAAVDGALRGARAKLTSDRVGYFCHPDWVSHAPVPSDLWRPAADTPARLAETVAWYRAHRLL